MRPLVIEYLKTHNFQQLEDVHGVCARPSNDGSKFSLNYDQIGASKGDLLAEQCRGLIIRPTQWSWENFKDDWKSAVVGECEVVAWPMNRFYNHGDSSAHEIDRSHPQLRVYEKLDGTCIILYWDKVQGRWHAATRSVPEADIPIFAGHPIIGNATFSQLFLRALVATREEQSGKKVDWAYCNECKIGIHQSVHPELPCPDSGRAHSWSVDGPEKVVHLNKELTYVFELVSPYNQIVVSYPEPRVYLLAVRHTTTGTEIPIDQLHLQHVRHPKTWPMRDVAELTSFIDSTNPSELEGAVICVPNGSSFVRQKVKSSAYVLAHRSKDAVTSSPRNLLEAIILEKDDDIIPLVPAEVADKIASTATAYHEYCSQIDARARQFAAEAGNNRKEYARLVMATNDWHMPYFALWEKKENSAKEIFKRACMNHNLSATALDKILDLLTMAHPNKT